MYNSRHALTMQFLRITKNNCKIGVNQNLKRMILLKICQTCLYLMVVDNLSKIKVFCAVSSENDFLKEMVINKCNEVIEKESDCLLLKFLKTKIKREYSKISTSNIENQPLPSTSESAQLQLKVNLFEAEINSIESDFNSLLYVKIPERLEDLKQLNDQYVVINLKVNIIKEIPQSYVSAFIKRIETKLQEKQKVNYKFEQTLNNMQLSTEKIKKSFAGIVNGYLNMKRALVFIGSKIIDEYGNTFISKTDAENKRMLKFLSDAQLALEEDKSHADSILMILSKFLVMTQEDFNADHEVINAILTLK